MDVWWQESSKSLLLLNHTQKGQMRIKQHMPPKLWHGYKLGFILYNGMREHTSHFQMLPESNLWRLSIGKSAVILMGSPSHMTCGCFQATFSISSVLTTICQGILFSGPIWWSLCFLYLYSHLLIITLYNSLFGGKFSSMILSGSNVLWHWPGILLLHLCPYVDLVFSWCTIILVHSFHTFI